MTLTLSPKQLLLTPVGEPGSGARRYGAAMALYAQGEMPAVMLEIYRRCCKFDREDPVAVARYEGVCLPDLLKSEP